MTIIEKIKEINLSIVDEILEEYGMFVIEAKAGVDVPCCILLVDDKEQDSLISSDVYARMLSEKESDYDEHDVYNFYGTKNNDKHPIETAITFSIPSYKYHFLHNIYFWAKYKYFNLIVISPDKKRAITLGKEFKIKDKSYTIGCIMGIDKFVEDIENSDENHYK
jgi:hypothetical protein